MWMYIAGGTVAAVALVVGGVALQPAEFRVARSATIAASPEAVFPHVNDLHAFQQWSPYAGRDPQCQTSYAGPSAGPGAEFHWDGNAEVGEGSLTIIESRTNELVRMRLDFVRPFEGSNTVAFTFEPHGAATRVTWAMSGRNGLAGKAMSLVIDCDAMCGRDFEQGLANLAAIVERDESSAAMATTTALAAAGASLGDAASAPASPTGE